MSAPLIVSSQLPAECDVLWAHATSIAGINLELWPLLQMTAPAGITSLADLDETQLGEPIGTSWLLFLGVLPIDRMMVTPKVLETFRFVEESKLIWLKGWRHERTVTAVPDGCVVTDQLTPTARIPGVGPLLRFATGALFRHRHRRLAAMFGEEAHQKLIADRNPAYDNIIEQGGVNDLRFSDYRHGPFDDEVRALLQELHDKLAEVHPLSLEQWEDGFRRDTNPEKEIALWLHLARVYEDLVTNRLRGTTPGHRLALFKLLLAGLSGRVRAEEHAAREQLPPRLVELALGKLFPSQKQH